jgi:hypothetical protein
MLQVSSQDVWDLTREAPSVDSYGNQRPEALYRQGRGAWFTGLSACSYIDQQLLEADHLDRFMNRISLRSRIEDEESIEPEIC